MRPMAPSSIHCEGETHGVEKQSLRECALNLAIRYLMRKLKRCHMKVKEKEMYSYDQEVGGLSLLPFMCDVFSF